MELGGEKMLKKIKILLLFSYFMNLDGRTNVHYNGFIAVLEFGSYEGDEAHELQEINI